jgi:transposase
VTKIVRQLGTHPNNLYKWRTQFAADGEESFSGHGHVRTSDEEPQRLWRENMRLREERDILRKALVFFSKESQ